MLRKFSLSNSCKRIEKVKVDLSIARKPALDYLSPNYKLMIRQKGTFYTILRLKIHFTWVFRDVSILSDS